MNSVSQVWFRYNLHGDICFWMFHLCMSSGGWLQGWLCTCLKDHCSLLHTNFSRVYSLWKHHFPLVYKFTATTIMLAAALPSVDNWHYWLDTAWKKSLMVPQALSKFIINCTFDHCMYISNIYNAGAEDTQQSTIGEIMLP
jgi:hypothetical protein